MSQTLQTMIARMSSYWFAPTDAMPIAVFRVLLGTYLCVFFALFAPDVPTLFSSDGVYWSLLLGEIAPSAPVAYALWALTLALSVLFTLGVRTRWVTPALLTVYAYHYVVALSVKHSSFERLIAIYLLVLSCADCDGALALKPARNSVSTVWPLRVLRYQTIMLYLGAGLWKAFHADWHSGALLQSTMQSMWATPTGFQLARAFRDTHTWQWFSWAVIVGELVIAAALTWRPTRWLGIVLGTAFHLANAVILAIPEFVVCIAPYALFVEATTLRRWLRMR